MIETAAIFLSLALLLLLDLLLVATRSSFLQSSPARLLAQREQSEEQVNRTLALLDQLPRLRAGLNLALVLTRFGLAGLVLRALSFQTLIFPVFANIVILIAAALLLFESEWAVEKIVSQNPENRVLYLEPFAAFWLLLAKPFLNLQGVTKGALAPLEAPGLVTEDDLKTLVDAGQEKGLFEHGERQMIYSVFELRDTLAREIMVPRIDMVALEVHTSLDEAADAILKYGHSRVPVYEEIVDKVLGLLYAKDLLRVWREGVAIDSLQSLLRPAYFVPEAKKVDEMLAEMQSQRIHMAIVVDEYGGVAGLVTLEDIVEEVVGEIRDEYDQSEEAPYQELREGGYVFQGRIDLDDFNEIMASTLPKSDADTLGGYIYSVLGRVPAVGDEIREGNLLLIVEQVSTRRIRKVRARWLPEDAPLNDKEEKERVDRRDETDSGTDRH